MTYFVDRLKSISVLHGNSLRTLALYVLRTRAELAKATQWKASLLRKILLATDRKEGNDTVHEDSIRLEFTEEEYGLLRRMMEDDHQETTKFPSLLFEMAFIYRVALHDALIPDVLAAVFWEFPNMLKSKKTMTHEEIVGFMGTNSLVQGMTDKELSRMGRVSIEKQLEYVASKLGIALVSDKQNLDKLIELMPVAIS